MRRAKGDKRNDRNENANSNYRRNLWRKALAVTEAVRRGPPVRAFARSADKLVATDLLDPVQGDARLSEGVMAPLPGVRAVIFALVIKERLAMLCEEEALFSETTAVLLKTMKTSDVCRLVVVTGFGAGGSRSAVSTLESIERKVIHGRPYADEDRQEAMITSSDLDRTIARQLVTVRSSTTGGDLDPPVVVTAAAQ